MPHFILGVLVLFLISNQNMKKKQLKGNKMMVAQKHKQNGKIKTECEKVC